MQRFLYAVEGDTDPQAFTVQDDTNTAVDLSSYSTVEAVIRYDTGSTAAVTCSVVSAAAGTVTIPWTSSSTLLRGTHEMGFKLTTGAGKIKVLPSQYLVSLIVRPNIETS